MNAANLKRELMFAVFANDKTDAIQLTEWKRTQADALRAYRRSSHPKINGRMLRAKNFVVPPKEAAA